MIKVVAAIIRNNQNEIFIAQRNQNKSQGGLWEFPGGKIEPNETENQAIIREIKEELDMNITVIDKYTEIIYEYPDKTINLIVLNCQINDNHYALLEHQDSAWTVPSNLKNYEFAPADKIIISKLNNNKIS